MESLSEKTISCPYCGATSQVLVVFEDVGSEYIEDCQVCCRPVVFAVTTTTDGALSLSVRSEDETF